MAKTLTKTLDQKLIEAETLASQYLADANEQSERGNRAKSEKLFDKAQYWLDRYNTLVGNA